MRLSELLGSEVVDEQGRRVGRVHDARLVQDGPLLEGFGAAFRVDGLLVGGPSLGVRLGYRRAGVRGPWLVRSVFGAIQRRARFVGWDRVRSVEGGVVRISGTADDLSPPPAGGG